MPATPLTTDKRVGAERKDERSKATHRTELFLIMAVLLLGTNPVAVKYAVSAVPPLPFVALRFMVAGLLLLGAVSCLRSGGGVDRKDLLPMMGVGAVGVGMTNMLFTSGVNLTSASDTALLYAVVPVWGMILGSVLGLERPTFRGILGVGLAFMGIVAVVYGGLGGSGSSLKGNLLVLGATVCWGSYTVLSLPLLKKYSPLVVAAYTMLFGGLAALPFAFPSLASVDWDAMRRSPTRPSWWLRSGSSPGRGEPPSSAPTKYSFTSTSSPLSGSPRASCSWVRSSGSRRS
jgi:drug/metabolite transporter (DMT)-like permease